MQATHHDARDDTQSRRAVNTRQHTKLNMTHPAADATPFFSNVYVGDLSECPEDFLKHKAQRKGRANT